MRKLEPLSQEQTNQCVPFSWFQSIYKEYQITQKGNYYPYNHEIRDKGWGCAWRAIQMLISSFGHEIAFQSLFHNYGYKEKLLKIIQTNKMYSKQLIEQLRLCKWSPQQSQSNWAQPFIGKIICQNLNIKNTRLAYIGQPCKSGKAPEGVFPQIWSFAQFWKLIKNHFPNNGPIMIDDGYIALCIIGCKQSSENDLHIILGDPHISSNRKLKETGIYEVILDKQGACKQYLISESQLQGANLSQAYKLIYFTKPWMVLIAQHQE